jgi:NAD(P)-dependent dehydrogenase (short-subunit alcohol dehydrogenase family)
MGQLDGKVGIITGAASGIGAACARILAQEGAKLVLTDVDQTGGERVAGEVDGAFVRHDVTSEGGWPAVAAMAEQRFGGLHILVANAGIAIMGPVTEMPYVMWRRQMAVNVDGMFLAVKHCLPLMRRCGGGSIVMMSSVAGLNGAGELAGYSATKGAVRLFAKSMALECAQARDNIRVNSVHPGVIDTPSWNRVGSDATEPLDANSIATAQVPLGQAGLADDVANGVLFLASDASRYITGSELVIDGGMTAGRITRLQR